MKKEYIPSGLSLIATIMSIIAICVSAYRSPELGFDYIGVIVGVLALLVTILIAWQIYSMIDFNSKKRDLYTLTNIASNDLQSNMATSEYANWMIYHYLLLKTDPLGLDYRFLQHGISCLLHTSNIEDIETCNVVVKGLLECFINPHEVKMPQLNKDQLILLLSKVKHTDRIKDYSRLVEKIIQINVKQ